MKENGKWQFGIDSLKNKTMLQNLIVLFFCFFVFLSYPFSSKAGESDFKVNSTNTFPVVELKIGFKKYEGKISRKSSRMVEQVFPDQKLSIVRTGEWGGRLVYDGKPLVYKEKIEFNQLIFSPDHKVAIAFGTAIKPSIFFIDDTGNIFKKIGLSAWFVKASEDGFVVLGRMPSHNFSNGTTGNFLIKFNLAGEELWKKELTSGGLSYITPTKLSISNNGKFIVISLDKKNETPGSTQVLDKNGNELEKFSETYNSFFLDDNESVVLVSRKHLRVVNLKEKTILFKRDLDEKSNLLFVLPEGDQGNKVIIGQEDRIWNSGGSDYKCTLNEILAIDLKTRKVTRLMMGSKDFRSKKLFYSVSENKIIFKSIGLKDFGECESIEPEN